MGHSENVASILFQPCGAQLTQDWHNKNKEENAAPKRDDERPSPYWAQDRTNRIFRPCRMNLRKLDTRRGAKLVPTHSAGSGIEIVDSSHENHSLPWAGRGRKGPI